MVRKTVHRTENNYLLLQPAMLETGLQTPHDGAEDGAAPYAGDAGIALVAGKAGILHFFAGSTSDVTPPRRLHRNIRSMPNGYGLIHDNTRSRK